jgi:hypothetical protein
MDTSIAYLYSLQGGRITRFRVYDDRSEAEQTAESEMESGDQED